MAKVIRRGSVEDSKDTNLSNKENVNSAAAIIQSRKSLMYDLWLYQYYKLVYSIL